MDSFRSAISTQMILFKIRAFEREKYLRCPVTGCFVPKIRCHVDHTPPDTFVSLVDKFLVSNDLNLYNVKVKQYTDTPKNKNNPRMMIVDDNLRDSWCAFHFLFAKLRITSPEGNLRLRYSHK